MPRSTDAGVRRDGDALVLTGVLARDAVPALWRDALPLLDGVRRIDLSAATAIDSAGVALVAELAARAGATGVDGAPPGLDGLRAAYRLDPALRFQA